jgi:hypothetical protein
MTESLTCGVGALVKLIYWDGSVPPAGAYTAGASPTTFYVYDFSQPFSKMSTAAGDRGAFGFAAWREDKAAWEIIGMQTPGMFWGTVSAGGLTQAMSGCMVDEAGDVLDGYDVFQANHGNTILVSNPVGGGRFAAYWFASESGDRVL